ncbi:hypothetical protein [Rubrivirga marina]|uniref:Bacterial surface antigen (D15) domain-containing protein n=1 Tax=Rubrivirga marina TaxID=1196024 RepID=A0A271J3K9_9BACT|nr:hypothetical protein [Rubrivirga marina]PAP77545.1 hypothetical protein BSZ37_14395 [Rubrivirga marina]
MPALLLVLAALFQQTPPPAPPDTTETPTEQAADVLDQASDVVSEGGTYDENAEESGPGITFRPRIAPSALYSSGRGFGIGGGVGIRNLVRPGTDLVLDVRLQQRFQSADATFFTADPYDTRLHALFNVGGATTQRRRYYGLGPNTVADSELNLYHDAAQAEVRLGYYPLGTTAIYVQPGVRFLYDYSGGVNEDASENRIDDLFPVGSASNQAVRVAEDEARYGASIGVEIATDLRDWPAYARRGFFGTAEHRRFYAFDESKLTLARYTASGLAYLPIRGRTTLITRGVLAVTRSGDADGDGEDDDIPFYYLPTLDDRVATAFQQDRLSGRDLLALGVGVRAPIVDLLGIYGIDMLVMGYLGNAYDNVFEQFIPKVSFEEGSFRDEAGRAYLRPALGLGLGIVNLDKERVVVGGLVGIGPGGLSLATLRIAYDLRDARPLFR